MAFDGFVGGDAGHASAQGAGAFGGVGGPHLEEAIGEAGFEDSTCNRLEGHLIAEVCFLPDLFLGALEGPEGFGLFGAVADAAVGAEDFDPPCIGFAGGHAFHFESHGDFLAVDRDVGVEKSVVPGVAGGHAAFAVGAFGVDFLELCEDAFGIPAEAEGDVDDVHTEVAHDADFTAEFCLTFPVDGFGGVEVAGVPEAGMDFKEFAELAGLGDLEGALCAGHEGEFGAAADEFAGFFGGVADGAGGFEVDAEGFFGEEVFAGVEDVEV